MRRWTAVLLFLLGGPLSAGAAVEKEQGAGPVLSMMMTCASLTPAFYPADTTNWFDPARDPQVVFSAHMLFPLLPQQGGAKASSATVSVAVADHYFAEAHWMDPDGGELAYLGLTMPARVSTDYVTLAGVQYIPHTFSMAVGTTDIRPQAGQKALPAKPGQYHIRLLVDGHLEGLAFFRILGGVRPAVRAAPAPVTTTGQSPLWQALYQALSSTAKPAK